MSRTYHILAIIPLVLLASAVPRAANRDAEPDPTAAVVAKVNPAVVRIVVVRPPKPDDVKPATGALDIDGQSDRSRTAIGSGFIIDPAGFIATNRHVVENAISVFVVTNDGIRYQAKIVGMTSKADMALLRIDAGRVLPSIPFGDSEKMQVGETVIAIGNPFGFDSTVTTGTVSAVNRDITESPFDDYIQTDAPTNRGNSGGPLLNLAGEVIGMNSVIVSPNLGWSGLTFAIPSNSLHFVFDRLMKTGEIKAGMLPVQTQQVTWTLQQALGAPGTQGALVSAVDDDGDVVLQGKLKPGDVILSFNGQTVLDSRDLARKTARAPIGSDAALEVYRGGAREATHVTIQALPVAKTVPAPTSPPQKIGVQLVSGQKDNGEPVVMVAYVDPTGTAADSSLEKGDIIVEVQRTPVSDPDQASRLLVAQSGTKHPFAAVLVERANKRTWVSVALPN